MTTYRMPEAEAPTFSDKVALVRKAAAEARAQQQAAAERQAAFEAEALKAADELDDLPPWVLLCASAKQLIEWRRLAKILLVSGLWQRSEFDEFIGNVNVAVHQLRDED